MSKIFASTFLVLISLNPLFLFAQLPPNQPEQDCFSALSVCQDIFFQPNAYSGAGRDPDEINGTQSCLLLGERNSVWYIFTVQTQGELCFTIMPVDPLDDYDWALYNLTNASCADIPVNPNLEVACSWTYNYGCQGFTGANGNMANCPGQSTPCLTVNPGQTYVLNISNFTASNAGYTLNFSQSTARLFDDIQPTLDEVTSFCTGVTAKFSENISCATVDPADFTFTGPDGPYTISQVISRNCANGGAFDSQFDLIISPPIQQAGNYILSLTGTVNDLCGNAAVLSSHDVFMPLPPTAALNAPGPQCQLGNQFGFAYTGPSAVRSYNWNFGDSTGSAMPSPIHSYQSAGTKTVTLIITDVNGCPDTATQQVDVLPKPDVRFNMPLQACEGDTLAIDNQTTFPGSPMTSLVWRIADGTVTSDFSPVHHFAGPGRYQIFLEAVNLLGCRDTASRFVSVYPKAEVDFLIEDNVCNGDSAHFVFLSTIRNDLFNDQIVDWEWKFGDSTGTSRAENPVYLYDTAGVYPVVLLVTSDKGCVDSLVQDQMIHQPPPPIINDNPVCFGKRSNLEAIPVEGGITSWFYEAEDSTAFHRGATYYSPPVTYPYDLYVEQLSPEGCLSDRVLLQVTHHELGFGEIVSDSVVEFPNPIVNFSVGGTILAEQYLWTFGDGVTSTSTDPAHEFKFPNQYKVQAKVTDIYGCEYDLEKTIEVKAIIGVHIPTAFTPNGDGYNDEFFVEARLVQQFAFTIFNRFGEEIFTSNDPAFRWDGRTASGYAVKEGVYAYRMQATDVLGNSLDEEGTITVLK
ncbi:MAG: PKD domain-containing protein [Bacteroidia bacterium]|nr:PKD domain-containing protein [Bacteroidia bacterium]